MKDTTIQWSLLIAVFVIAFSVCLAWQYSLLFPDPDAFYHAKIGEMMGQGKLVLDFPWQQYSSLVDNYWDQHFLFHVFLGLFMKIFGAFAGIKLSTIFLCSGFIFIFGAILKLIDVRQAWIYSLILLFSTPLTFRLNLVKATPLSLIVLFLGIYLLYKKKYLWLFILSFIYVWTYGGFPLLLGIVGLYAIINFIYNKKLKENLYLIGSVAGGMLAGLIANPYFPGNIYYFWQQFVQIGLINYQDKIGVGGEWYPYGLAKLISGAPIVCLLMVVSLFLFFYFLKRQKQINWLSLFLCLMFLGLTLKSRRYVEYFIPFSVFFSALTLAPVMARLTVIKVYDGAVRFVGASWFKAILVGGFILFAFFMVPAIYAGQFKENLKDLRRGYDFYKFSDSMNWLKENSEEGDIVLHSDWDEFPILFFWNNENYYIVGLDPTFMYNYDEEKYWLWVNITLGKEKEDLYKKITENFNAKYVFLETDHKKMDANFRHSNGFELVYEDEEAKIYKLKK